MSIDSFKELKQRRNIAFPYFISGQSAIEMFETLVQEGVETRRNISIRFGERQVTDLGQEREIFYKRNFGHELSGSISIENEFSPFYLGKKSIHTTTDRILYGALTFDTVGRDSLMQFRPEEVAVWDETRRLIGNYFKSTINPYYEVSFGVKHLDKPDLNIPFSKDDLIGDSDLERGEFYEEEN